MTSPTKRHGRLSFPIILTLILFGMHIDTVSAQPTASKAALQWTSLPDLPDPIGRGGPIVGVHGDVLIVAGGANFPQDPPWSVDGRPPGKKIWHTSNYALDSGTRGEEPQWLLAGELPLPLGYAANVSTADGLYVLGGESFGVVPGIGTATAPQSFATAEVLRLQWNPESRQVDVVTNALPPLPRACTYHAAEIVGSRIYVAASHAASSNSQRLDEKHFWSLDLSRPAAERQWESLSPWPGAAREKCALVAQQADSTPGSSLSLYLIGGATWAKHEDGSADDPGSAHFSDGYRFDPQSREWTSIADLPFLPEERSVNVDGYQWNATANSWERSSGAKSPNARETDDLFRSAGRPLGAAPAVAWGERTILIFSGSTGRYVTLPVQDRPDFPRDVVAYDTMSNTWSRPGAMPTGVVTTSAVLWQGRIVIPSGETRPGVRTPRVQAVVAE